MNLRRLFAIGIALLMLCGSCFASVCDLNCSLPHQHPAPTKPSPVSDTQSEAVSAMSPSHCGHAMAGSPRTTSTRNYSDHSTCKDVPCGQVVLSSALSNARIDVKRLPADLGDAAVLLAGAAISSNQLQKINYDHSPPNLSSAEPLTLALRI